jgi:Flp pilus assembly protein TadB
MSYRVRTPDGELEFASLYEISNALRHGLVEGEDEVLVPGQTSWVRVCDHSALKAHVRSGKGRPGSVLGGLELGATVASALVALTGILAGWSYWVVGAAVLVAVWLSTRMAMRSSRVRASNRVDSRRR